MPELPEVETIKNDLSKKIIGRKIISVFPLWKDIVKDVPFDAFAKQVEGRKIVAVERRAKNLIIKLSGGVNLLIHLKMTGHLFIAEESSEISKEGKWIKTGNQDLLHDPQNQHIRIIFHLDNGKILAMGDTRKFAYIKLLEDRNLKEFLDGYGPEPFSPEFTEKRLKEILKSKKTAIKKVLMDQRMIAGIGNIYADEILWASRVHPLSISSKLTDRDIKAIYQNTRKILKMAIKKRGTSISDFRDAEGKRGAYEKQLNAYQRNGHECSVCGENIRRIEINKRGTHFCPVCQKESK